MASMFQKIADFARGPQGRRVTEQVKRYAQDPKNEPRHSSYSADSAARAAGAVPATEPRQSALGEYGPPVGQCQGDEGFRLWAGVPRLRSR